MFPLIKEKPNKLVLVGLCEEATHVDDIFQNLPEAVATNFNAEIIAYDYNVYFSKEVPNTHSCPLTGELNFMRNSDKPLYYSGLTGYMNFTIINHNSRISSTGIIGNHGSSSIAGINLGSGGGSSLEFIKDGELFIAMHYKYDVKVFVDDFPFLKDVVENHYDTKEKEANRLENLHKLKHPNYYYYRRPIELQYEGQFKDDRYKELKY